MKRTDQTESVDSNNEEIVTAKSLKKTINELLSEAERMEVPIFVAYYDKNKGYQQKAVLPEQFDSPEMQKQYGKFRKFMKVCIDLNEGMPIAQSTNQTGSF